MPTPSLTPGEVAELRRLYEPIRRENFRLDPCLQRKDWEATPTSRPAGCVTVRNSVQGHRIRDIHDLSCDEAAFVVAAHNQFPRLLDAVDENESHWAYWECERDVNAQTDGKILARFADAVLNLPTSVRLAIHAKSHGRNRELANGIIADWVVSLIGPNAKETTE